MAQTTVFYNGVRNIEFEITDNAGKIQSVIIKGSGAGLIGPDAKPLPAAGAYGITVIDADAWAAIEEKYGEMQIFKDGLIRAGVSEKAKAAAKEEVSSKDNGQGPADQEEAGKRKKKK